MKNPTIIAALLGQTSRELPMPIAQHASPFSSPWPSPFYVFGVRSAAVLGSSNVSTPSTPELFQISPAHKPAAPGNGRTPLNLYSRAGGKVLHFLSAQPNPVSARRTYRTTETVAGCSLSLRERVRVGGIGVQMPVNRVPTHGVTCGVVCFCARALLSISIFLSLGV